MLTEKVVWKDGLFVQPQHFQQSEQYLLDIVNNGFSSYTPYYYGLINYSVDTDLLNMGKFAIIHATGIMPDHTHFSIPKVDTAPAARTIEEHFDMQRSDLDVFLAIPLKQPGKPAYSDGSVNMDMRFYSEIKEIEDEVFCRTRESVEVGKHNFTVKFSNESLDNYSSFQIARLKRTTDGTIILDESFIPPVLRINASEKFTQILQSLLAGLHTKAAELLKDRRQDSISFVKYSSRDLSNYAVLNSILTFTPKLNQLFQQSSKVHPYEVYNVLTMMAGSFQTFLPGNEIASQPLFDYNNMSYFLNELVNRISRVISVGYSPHCIEIGVTQIGETMYQCNIQDSTILKTSELFLGITAKTSQEQLGGTVKHIVKMSSTEKLRELIITAMNGLTLNLVINPPVKLTTKPGYIYLRLEKEGIHWENILTTGSIAFYIPNVFPEMKMEMLAVKN